MNIEKSKLTRSEIVLLLFGLFTLIVILFVFNRPPFYDEDDYLKNVALLQKYGFSRAYLVNLIGSAGPLYSTVHYILEPLTDLQAPYIRLVNIGFLLGIIYFTGRTVQLLNFTCWTYGLNSMAIPMTYVISGLALTEIPAMFFYSAGIYLIIKAISSSASNVNGIIKLITGGICISLAILGRQPYLLTLAAFPILFYNKKNYKKNSILLIITIIFSVALPCYVFSVWNGLVAPLDALFYDNITRQGVSYRPDFFFYAWPIFQ